jgi:hypothetical protein
MYQLLCSRQYKNHYKAQIPFIIQGPQFSQKSEKPKTVKNVQVFELQSNPVNLIPIALLVKEK